MNSYHALSQKTSLPIIVAALIVLVLLGLSESALAAKGIIKGVGTGGGTGGSITVSDLGITDVGTLPSSKWYVAKEWRRGFERFFTFNAVAKTELELRITNEKAAEVLLAEEANLDDTEALLFALENYTKAQERLAHRLRGLKETSENPNVEKLLEKLDRQNLKHALLMGQLAERWSADPYVEDANIVNPQGARDNHLQGAVDIAQKQIQGTVIIASEKEKNIEAKAAEAIKRAEMMLRELESQLAELIARDVGVSDEQAGPTRLDPTPARISTNMTIERQTPKRDFGDRMKAGLDTAGGILVNAKEHLVRAEAAFAMGKFGEAFGEAQSAEVLAINGSRVLSGVLRADTGGLEDEAKSMAPPMPNVPMPIMPSTVKAGDHSVPVRQETATESPARVTPPVAPPASKSLQPCTSPSATNCTPQPTAIQKVPDGYTFEIIGFVHDIFDAQAMTSGIPVGGALLRATGPKTFTAQSRSNGAYTLSFVNAPLGTYDVCVTPPSGYRQSNTSTGCTTVVVRHLHDTTIELTADGHVALNGTVLHFDLLRQTDGDCPTAGPAACGKDGRTYYNACFAARNGAEVSYEGECSLDGWLRVNGGTVN